MFKNEINKFKYLHSSCSVIGIHHLLGHITHSLTDCKAKTVLCVAYISKEVFDRIELSFEL